MTTVKSNRLQENRRLKCGKVNDNVILDVAVLGPKSSNGDGRIYTEEYHRSAIKFYEGILVAPDHPTMHNPRSVLDTIGQLKELFVQIKNDGPHTFAKKLIINPHHPHAKQILWAAENNPDSLGLSHDVLVESNYVKKTGELVVTKCLKAFEVALVIDPATNKNLFESENLPSPEKEMENLKM